MLIRLGGGLGVGSIVLLLLGTQWYILFNVIAGAMAIPTDLKEAAAVFKFGAGHGGESLSCLASSLICNRDGDSLRRCVERQHHGRIFSFQGANILDRGTWRHYQPRDGIWQLQPADCLYNRHGCHRGCNQPFSVA